MANFSSAVARPIALAALSCVALAGVLGVSASDWSAGGSTPPPATQPATHPTTLPALSPADSALLKKLETGSWRERRAAADQLKQLDDSVAAGDKAELTLRAMLAQTASPEARAHLNAALSALAENRLIGPSYITLHLTDAPASQVFPEVFRQARWPGHVSADDFKNDTNKLTVNADHQPFWKVFPPLADQCGYGLGMVNAAEPGLIRVGPMPNGPSDIEGAFMTVATQLSYMHSVALSTNQFRDNLSFSLEVTIYAEPKIELLRLSRQVKVIHAVDDHGNSLLPDGPIDDSPQDAGGAPFTLDAPLKFPDKNPGTRLAHFRGSVLATVQTAEKRIEITDLMTAKPRPLSLGNTIVTFAGCKPTGDTDTLTLTLPMDGQNNWGRVFDEAQQRLHVYDAAGNELERNGAGDSVDNNLVTITLEFTKGTTPDGKPQGPPAHLIWDVPTTTRDLTIPIEFKNLNMNIVGGQ